VKVQIEPVVAARGLELGVLVIGTEDDDEEEELLEDAPEVEALLDDVVALLLEDAALKLLLLLLELEVVVAKSDYCNLVASFVPQLQN
jgi:hypothetical protein